MIDIYELYGNSDCYWTPREVVVVGEESTKEVDVNVEPGESFRDRLVIVVSKSGVVNRDSNSSKALFLLSTTPVGCPCILTWLNLASGISEPSYQ